jgi:hypothetical protein
LTIRSLKLANVFWLDVRLVFGRVARPRRTVLKRCPPGQSRSLATTASPSFAGVNSRLQHEPWQTHQWSDDFFSTSGPAEPRFDWRARASCVKPISSGKLNRRYKRRADPAQMPTMQQDPYYNEIQAYEKRCVVMNYFIWLFLIFSFSFLPLIEAEQQEEEALIKERLSTWSIQRLKSEGYCIAGMSAFWLQDRYFGRDVAAFSLGPGIHLPYHRFEYVVLRIMHMCELMLFYSNGMQVLVTHLDPLTETPHRGRVTALTPTQIRVSFQERFELNEPGGSWRWV